MTTTFSACHAAERITALLDPGSFLPDPTVPAEMPLVVGTGMVQKVPVLVACTDGHRRGGTVGVAEAEVLARTLERARADTPPAAIILGFDTGGVRVDEGPVALAATSAVGVALARLTVQGARVMGIISGPRGCFGALSVMAALPEHIIMTEGSYWGLTGPKLIGPVQVGAARDAEGFAATAANNRLRNGDVHAVVPDTVTAVCEDVQQFIKRVCTDTAVPSIREHLTRSAAAIEERYRRVQHMRGTQSVPDTSVRQRNLLRYSFRRQWQPTSEIVRRGLIDAALGTLATFPTLSFVVGPEQPDVNGVGIEEASVVAEMLQQVTAAGTDRRVILTFLFCQGHAVGIEDESCGLSRALAECVRMMVAARLLGHIPVTVIGGGAYGAAYFTFAAPSQRVLALRGTTVAPMAPQVLEAFQALRGRAYTPDADNHLAELIPEVHTVETVFRLPRALREEIQELWDISPSGESPPAPAEESPS